MERISAVSHQFVKNIPGMLDDGVVYVSIEYGTVVHKCCCGCGEEVVTPLSPTDWKLVYDGKTISISPSIGNWGFKCGSHYWIIRNSVRWARKWSAEKIRAGRDADRRRKQRYFADASLEGLDLPISSDDASRNDDDE